MVECLVAVVETEGEERGFPADRHVVSIEGERLVDGGTRGAGVVTPLGQQGQLHDGVGVARTQTNGLFEPDACEIEVPLPLVRPAEPGLQGGIGRIPGRRPFPLRHADGVRGEAIGHDGLDDRPRQSPGGEQCEGEGKRPAPSRLETNEDALVLQLTREVSPATGSASAPSRCPSPAEVWPLLPPLA